MTFKNMQNSVEARLLNCNILLGYMLY